MTWRSGSWTSVGFVGRWRVALVVGVALTAGLLFWATSLPLVWKSAPESASETTRTIRVAVTVTPQDERERAAVLELALDVWTDVAAPGLPLTVVLDENHLSRLELPYAIVVDDIDEVARLEKKRIETRASARDGGGWFEEYRDIGEIGAFMDSLAEQHSGATIKRFGTSLEGWPLRAFEIGRGDVDIVINGGQHAREWISVMVPLCIAERLLARDALDPRIKKILDAVTFHIAPLVNPDGYVHSWNVDRYWRKNRRGGHGVDLNRNYSVAWGQRGSSSSKRSQTYRGTSAFSEPESQAMRSLFESVNAAAHIDFHSYSQLILYPWTHTRKDPPDRDKLAAIADRMSSAMTAEHGVHYKILSGAQLGGGASGSLADWVYGEKGALSFIVELRPARGSTGFVLPPEQIVPTCDESFAAATELAEWMIEHN